MFAYSATGYTDWRVLLDGVMIIQYFG